MEQQQQPMKCPSCGVQLPAGNTFCPWDGHKLAPASRSEGRADPLLGTHVSEYVLQERIGAGGMGIVYRAVQPLIGKQVAIKVLKAELGDAEELVQRLLVEARVVNAIQHPGVIDIFGFGQLPDGRPYVVMELLQGVSLSSYIRRKKKLGVEEAVALLDEMLAALGAAHKGGVIHRDLKPGNVFLVERREGNRAVKLLDFGIAKVAEFRPQRPLTQEGSILGTPEYMAPEQVKGEKVSPVTDLYAMGVIAFQMLAGRLPFIGEPSGVLISQVEQAPPPLSSLAPDVPPAIESIVMRLLAKSPAKRFPSAEAVRKELTAWRAQEAARPAASETPTRSDRLAGPRTIEVPMLSAAQEETEPATIERLSDVAFTPRRAKPRWLALAVGAGALVASAGVVGFKTLRSSAPAPQPVAHVQQAEQAASSPVSAHQAPSAPTPPSAMHAPQPAQPVAAAAAAPSAPSKPRKVEAPKAPADEPAEVALAEPVKPELAATVKPANEAKVTHKERPAKHLVKASSPARVAASKPSIDQPTLFARLLDAEGRLLKVNPTACPVTSPAMARLRELQKQAQGASTGEDREKVVGLLAEWEQKFMAQR